MGLFDIFRRSTPTVEPKARGLAGAIRRNVRMIMGSADVNRLTGDWGTTPHPADWVISRNQRALVARSREQLANNDYFKAYARLCRINVVGSTGLVFHSQARLASGKPDKKAKLAVERFIADWSKPKNCDVAGKLSLRAIENHCINSAVTDGEFMLRMLVGTQFGKYGFQLQVLDPVRCPVDYDVVDTGRGTFIRHGIEFNDYGKPVAYHFAEPSAKRSSEAYSYAGQWYRRIPADEIIHGFRQELTGQKRGLPWLSTGLFRLKQMGAYEDAAIVNARVGAQKIGVVQFPEGQGPECNEAEGEDDLAIGAEPGEFLVLPNGATLDKFEATYPAGEFAPFMKQMLHGFAAGGGVSYHSLSGDLEAVNFSSIRQGTLDEREHFKELQEWLVEELAEPLFDALFAQAMLRGAVKRDDGSALPASKIDLVEPHEWQGRRWEWIDPNADMKAAEGRKNNLMVSPSALIREQGRDPAAVWQEMADDIEAMRAAGIPENIIEAAFSVKPAPPAPTENPANA